ncbi:unnamed protein product [Peniophora sp. CBMAI 1063]|nr:unnamed protein product [Peniophora sp. CBMAI 1063]
MSARGFPPEFLQISSELLDLPAEMLMGTPPEDLSPDFPETITCIIILSPIFVWKLESGVDNVRKLVDYLEYKVPLPMLDVALDEAHMPSNNEISSLCIKDMNDCPTIQAIFHHHTRRRLHLARLVRESPATFLKILAAVDADDDASNIELWDCLRSIELVARDYFADGCARGQNGPPPESTSQVDQLWRQLVEGGLPEILLGMLDCLFILQAIPCFTHILRGLVLWCSREPLNLSHTREDVNCGILTLLKKFWEEIWVQRNLLVKKARPLYLVYHAPDVESCLAILVLAQLAAEYIALSQVTHCESPGREAYMHFARVLVFIWLIPTMIKGPPEAETQHMLFILVALFTQHSGRSGLTPDDFSAFLDREVYAKYGAEVFLSNLDLALRAVSQAIPRRSYELDTRDTLDVIREYAVRPQCKRYFASSGLLQSIRDVLDGDLVRALPPDAQWMVQQSGITLLQRLVTLAPAGRTAKALLRGHSIFAIISESAIAYATAAESLPDDQTILNIIDMYITVAGGSRARGGREELLYAMKRSLQAHWYPTYRDLYAMVEYDARGAPFGKAVQPLGHWIELGNSLGLEVESEKDAYERRAATLCAWEECQFHEAKPPTATRACAGCGEVRYCSKGCQKRDWKEGGHGKRCKRLKEKAHNRAEEDSHSSR